MRCDFYQVPEQYVATVNGKRVVRTRMVTKVRWTPARGTVSRWFDDVLASHSLPRRIINELTPWDLENLTSYQDAHLSGFRSEVYQVPLDEGFRHAREEMDRIIRIDVAGGVPFQ